MISPAVRLRRNPIVPVAQNLQSRGQPTCVERHNVSRRSAAGEVSSGGIKTLSIIKLSFRRNKNLVVPSVGETLFLTRSRLSILAECSRTTRNSFEISVISSKDCAPLAYIQEKSWAARYFLSPRDSTKSCSSLSDSPLIFFFFFFKGPSWWIGSKTSEIRQREQGRFPKSKVKSNKELNATFASTILAP